MQVSIECEGSDIFVVADGVKIAKLGHFGTAETWVSLEPGFVVTSPPDDSEITIEFNGVRVQ